MKEGRRPSRSNSSSSSNEEDSITESLLLPSEKPPPEASTSFPPTSSSTSQPRHEAHFTISIPTRTSVTQSKRSQKSRPKHLKLLLIGFSSLLLFAWSSTEVLTRFTRFGGTPKIQVILMISNGMGKNRSLSLSLYLRRERKRKADSIQGESLV